MIKHRLMAIMISASMGASMLLSPVITLAAEETPAAEEVQEAAAEETPSEAESVPEEQKETVQAEEVKETSEDVSTAAEVTEPAEEKTEAVEDTIEETDESAPAGAVEEAPAAEKTEAEPAAAVPEEEVKETTVDGLFGAWVGLLFLGGSQDRKSLRKQVLIFPD